MTMFANIVYGTRLTDVNTCYKMMRTDMLRDMNLECERFEFCTEVTSKLARQHEKIIEVPMHYYPRSVKEGKKLGIRDGIKAITTILKFRFRK